MTTDPLTLIIFGISGNLAQIKLLPALYDLAKAGLLPENFSIVGVSRQPQSKRQMHEYLHEVLHKQNIHHNHNIEEPIFKNIADNLHHFSGDLTSPTFYKELEKYLDNIGGSTNFSRNRMFYLATYPDLYQTIFDNLKSVGLTKQDRGWVRLMIEKPIGNNEASAKKLNKLLLHYFTENQIFRLDHYLGKETMQNILIFRFGNGVFEHLMDNSHIDHIQITAVEDIGIGGRGAYFDTVGSLKDVGQNHILQMIALATMENPRALSNEAITQKRIQVIKSLKVIPKSVIYGQYVGYHNEKNVIKGSTADTFFAFKTEVSDSRFSGVPIYVRAGKKLARYVTEISIIFKTPPDRLFKESKDEYEPNVLTYRIFPNEGIVLTLLSKVPGHNWQLHPTYMQFCYKDLSPSLPDPYERLIMDAIQGDQTFFNDAPEIEAQWHFIDTLIPKRKMLHQYKPGSWGPEEADKLIGKDGRKWLEPSVEFCRT